jgi:rod shape-determining protein MreD
MSKLQLILLGILHFVLIAASQIFLFDNVHLLGYINPMIYVWFVLMLPYKTPRWATLLLSFAMGCLIDVCTFGQGFNMVTLTLIGFLRPFILQFYTSNRDVTLWQRPSLSDMGFAAFSFYVVLLVFIHHTLFFMLDIFRITEILPFLLRLMLSIISTSLVILLCDYLFMRKKL